MMKKLTLLSVALSAVLFASIGQQPTLSAPSMQDQSEQTVEQKKITTKKDLNEFIITLETAYKAGDKSKGYLLGGIYSQEHRLDDATVPPNLPIAIHYFNEALLAGYGLSAWHIVMLDLVPKKEYFKALDLLDKGLQSRFVDESGRITLALTLGTIVLENLNENQSAIRKARDIIYPYATRNNLASLDFVLANLLNLNDELEDANKFLNSACNNPAAPKEILNACMGGSEIVTSDNTGKVIKKDLATCR